MPSLATTYSDRARTNKASVTDNTAKRCPQCSGEAIEFSRNEIDGTWLGTCSCGTRGPVKETLELAIIEWQKGEQINKRFAVNCPFCASSSLDAFFYEDAFTLECRECGAMSPPRPTKKEVIGLWTDNP